MVLVLAIACLRSEVCGQRREALLGLSHLIPNVNRQHLPIECH